MNDDLNVAQIHYSSSDTDFEDAPIPMDAGPDPELGLDFEDAPEQGPDYHHVNEPWYPWLSRIHYYLTVLYHGSHRRNMDQATLRALMDIFRIYVPQSEYFPTLLEVVNFRFDFWEQKIFQTRVEGENVFSYLKPEGLIAMRLAHPKLSKSFDRVPRKNTI